MKGYLGITILSVFFQILIDDPFYMFSHDLMCWQDNTPYSVCALHLILFIINQCCNYVAAVLIISNMGSMYVTTLPIL